MNSYEFPVIPVEDNAMLTNTNCGCWSCRAGNPHADTHKRWFDISDRLLVPGSLKESDRVKQEACETCGHVRDKKGGRK